MEVHNSLEAHDAFEFGLPPDVRHAPKDATAELLLGVGSLVGQEVNLDELLRALVDRVSRSMQADRGTLYLLDPARSELFSRAAHLPELKQIRLKLGLGVAGHVAQTGEAINIPSTDAEGRFHKEIDRLPGAKTQT